jgi:hypothetical protein
MDLPKFKDEDDTGLVISFMNYNAACNKVHDESDVRDVLADENSIQQQEEKEQEVTNRPETEKMVHPANFH